MTILGRLGLSLMQGGCLLLLVVVSSSPVFAENLLTNSDFEQYDNGAFLPWSKNVSTLSLSATQSGDFIHTGSQAALIGSSANSTKYLYQIIPASPAATYQLSGWTKLMFGEGSAYLRVTECKTSTCSSSSEEIKSHDSQKLENPSGNDLSLEFTTATNAVSLKLKLSLDPKSAAETTLGWDSVQLTLKELATAPASSDSAGVAPPPPPSSPSAALVRLSYIVSSTLSADIPFRVVGELTGAKANTTYFIKSLGGVGSTSAVWRSVSTLNGEGSAFLAWNGNWSSMPKVTTDASGSAIIALTARFNGSTTVYGENGFLIRFREEGSEVNSDSEVKLVTVVPQEGTGANFTGEVATDSGAVEDTETSDNEPTVTIETKGQATVGAAFIGKVKVRGLSGNATYAYKVRIGKSSSSLSKGGTIKGDEILSDATPWAKFPTFTTNDGGAWEGEVTMLLKEGNDPGDYLLKIRVKDSTSSKLFDSSLQSILFAVNSENEQNESASSSGQVLGSSSPSLPSSLITLSSQMPDQEILPTQMAAVLAYDTRSFDFSSHLISMGLFMLGSSFLWSVKLLTNTV